MTEAVSVSLDDSIRGNPVLCSACSASNHWVAAQRLMNREDVARYLAVSQEQVRWLVNTGQITVLLVRGTERFDSRDLDLLISDYKNIAKRRAK